MTSNPAPESFSKDRSKQSIVGGPNSSANVLKKEDRAFHDWYRFVLSFPPHLVRHYLGEFGVRKGNAVLDPFCGTGTTLVESRLGGFQSVGIEALPIASFASKVKLNWEVDPEAMAGDSRAISKKVAKELAKLGIEDDRDCSAAVLDDQIRQLEPEQAKLLIKDSISPLPLHKSLVLLDAISKFGKRRHYDHLRLAFATALVHSFSNLRFGPEVGVGKIRADAPVLGPWLEIVEKMANDVRSSNGSMFRDAKVYLSDAREANAIVEAKSVKAVITSPPYPNEKDYSRTTRLESVLLGFFESMPEIRSVKKTLVRSNTRGVYKDDDDDQWIEDISEVQRLAEAIEARRTELGKTSGFERLYHRVTKLYFGGMARHLSGMREVLKPGAHLAYVVGDQASYLQITIRTGQILAEIATSLGFEHVRTDLFRKRFATATRDQLNEEVVIMRWPG